MFFLHLISHNTCWKVTYGRQSLFGLKIAEEYIWVPGVWTERSTIVRKQIVNRKWDFSKPTPRNKISCRASLFKIFISSSKTTPSAVDQLLKYQPVMNIPHPNHHVYMYMCIYTWIFADISSKLNVTICNIWKSISYYMAILILHLAKSTVMTQDNVIIKLWIVKFTWGNSFCGPTILDKYCL